MIFLDLFEVFCDFFVFGLFRKIIEIFSHASTSLVAATAAAQKKSYDPNPWLKVGKSLLGFEIGIGIEVGMT